DGRNLVGQGMAVDRAADGALNFMGKGRMLLWDLDTGELAVWWPADAIAVGVRLGGEVATFVKDDRPRLDLWRILALEKRVKDAGLAACVHTKVDGLDPFDWWTGVAVGWVSGVSLGLALATIPVDVWYKRRQRAAPAWLAGLATALGACGFVWTVLRGL